MRRGGVGIDQLGNPRPRASSVVSDEFRRFGIWPTEYVIHPVLVVTVTRDPKIVPCIIALYYYHIYNRLSSVVGDFAKFMAP